MAAHERRIDTAKGLVIKLVSVILDSNGVVLQRDRHLIDTILSTELKVRLIAEHLCDLELVLIPVLSKDCLDIAFGHIKDRPVDLGAVLTDPDSKSHIEMGALILATFNTVGVIGFLD